MSEFVELEKQIIAFQERIQQTLDELSQRRPEVFLIAGVVYDPRKKILTLAQVSEDRRKIYANSFYGSERLTPPDQWSNYIGVKEGEKPKSVLMVVTPVRSGSTAAQVLFARLVAKLNELPPDDRLSLDTSKDELRELLLQTDFSESGINVFQPMKRMLRHQEEWWIEGSYPFAKFTPGGPSEPEEVVLNPWEWVSSAIGDPRRIKSLLMMRDPYDRWWSTYNVVGKDLKKAPPEVQLLGDLTIMRNALKAMEAGANVVVVDYHLMDDKNAERIMEQILRRWGIDDEIINQMKQEGGLTRLDPRYFYTINWGEGHPKRNKEYFEAICLDAMTRFTHYRAVPRRGRKQLLSNLVQEGLSDEEINRILGLLDISAISQEAFLGTFGLK